jgi:hypothetical protein
LNRQFGRVNGAGIGTIQGDRLVAGFKNGDLVRGKILDTIRCHFTPGLGWQKRPKMEGKNGLKFGGKIPPEAGQ